MHIYIYIYDIEFGMILPCLFPCGAWYQVLDTKSFGSKHLVASTWVPSTC